MNYFNRIWRVYSCFLAVFIGSCGRGTPLTPGAMASIPGTWKIVKAVRNQDDITAGSDFGGSLITLDADGTYSLGKTAPFVVTSNGSWAASARPGGYSVVLKPRQDDPTGTYEMWYDTSGDRKNITVNFTTAGSNAYQYILERVNSKL